MTGRPLRIQFFVSFVHEQGTYFRYHNLAVGLSRLGHEVTVFGTDLLRQGRPAVENRDGVTYCTSRSWPGVTLFGHGCHPLEAAMRFVRRYPPADVAQLFQPFPAAAASWLRSTTRVKLYDWDDQWAGGLMSGPVRTVGDRWARSLVRVLEAQLPRRATHVTAASTYLADLARNLGAAGVTKLVNGYWPSVPDSHEAARAAVGLRPGALYVGFMGRTVAELEWCFEAVAAHAGRHPSLRLAVCGAPEAALEVASPVVRERLDYFGQLTPAMTARFAAGIDLGLLPLADNPFNRSRFPIKFCEHLATGVPLLCSEVGECGRLMDKFPWAIPAGTTRAEWLSAFGHALDRVAACAVPPCDFQYLREQLSWEALSRQLADLYSTLILHRK